MSKEKQTESEELFGIISDTNNGANFDDLNDAVYRILIANYHKQSEGEWRGEIRERCDWRGKKQKYFQPNSCSVCHEAVIERTPFCPYCGAKMKGGKDND